jgi:hypothetical protein
VKAATLGCPGVVMIVRIHRAVRPEAAIPHPAGGVIGGVLHVGGGEAAPHGVQRHLPLTEEGTGLQWIQALAGITKDFVQCLSVPMY